jgi:hypothetical protein
MSMPAKNRHGCAWTLCLKRLRLPISLLATIVIVSGCQSAQVAKTATPRPKRSPTPLTATPGPVTSVPPGAPQPMPVISRNVPAYSVNGDQASYGNDGTYGPGSGAYDGVPPTSLIYDLSRVPAAKRRQVVVAWYNDETVWYAAAINVSYYNEPRDYTIDASTAAGGGQPPGEDDPSWAHLVTVSGNVYNGRQHFLDLHGANWIRMRVTATNGASDNSDASFNLDVHDASQGNSDTWLFLGASVTQDGMGHYEPSNFMQQVNAADPPYFPSQLNGGLGGWDSGNPLATDPATNQQYLAEFLAAFPGHFVSLAYSSNDAIENVAPATYYSHMQTIVQAVLNAGKVPIVPMIPWGCNPNIQSDGPRLNQQVQNLWAAMPQIVHGPDFWSYFQAHQNLIGSDCIHPISPEGTSAYRQLFAQAMLSEVYHKTG